MKRNSPPPPPPPPPPLTFSGPYSEYPKLTTEERRVCMQFAGALHQAMGMKMSREMCAWTKDVLTYFEEAFNKVPELMRGPKTEQNMRRIAKAFGTVDVLDRAKWQPMSSCELQDEPHDHAQCVPKGTA